MRNMEEFNFAQFLNDFTMCTTEKINFTDTNNEKDYSTVVENGNLILSIILAGYKKDEIKVKTENNRLIITAETESDSKLIAKKLTKNFKLKDSYDTKKVKAILENGILILTFPLKDKLKAVDIPIK